MKFHQVPTRVVKYAEPDPVPILGGEYNRDSLDYDESDDDLRKEDISFTGW